MRHKLDRSLMDVFCKHEDILNVQLEISWKDFLNKTVLCCNSVDRKHSGYISMYIKKFLINAARDSSNSRNCVIKNGVLVEM